MEVPVKSAMKANEIATTFFTSKHFSLAGWFAYFFFQAGINEFFNFFSEISAILLEP